MKKPDKELLNLDKASLLSGDELDLISGGIIGNGGPLFFDGEDSISNVCPDWQAIPNYVNTMVKNCHSCRLFSQADCGHERIF